MWSAESQDRAVFPTSFVPTSGEQLRMCRSYAVRSCTSVILVL